MLPAHTHSCLQDPGNLLTGNANGYVGGQIYFDAFNVSPPFDVVDVISNAPLHFQRIVNSACGGLQVSLLCTLQARFGSGTGGIVAFGIPTVAAFCCGAMSVASNSR